MNRIEIPSATILQIGRLKIDRYESFSSSIATRFSEIAVIYDQNDLSIMEITTPVSLSTGKATKGFTPLVQNIVKYTLMAVYNSEILYVTGFMADCNKETDKRKFKLRLLDQIQRNWNLFPKQTTA